MDEISCKKCGSINDFTTVMKSKQLVATCNRCQSYIKNIPYTEPRLYFGKYKGCKIAEIKDVKYLEWLLENVDHIKKTPRENIKIQIDKLNNK